MHPKRSSIPRIPPRDKEVILVIRPPAPPSSAQEHRGSGLDLAIVGNGILLDSGLASGAGRFSAALDKNRDVSHFFTPHPFPRRVFLYNGW